MAFDASNLVGRELVWLLDLSYAGKAFYLSKDHESVTIDGETYDYHPGLVWGGTLDDQIDLLSDAPSPNQVSLTLHLQGLIDVPQHVSEGHDLAAATGKLWVWPRGTADRLLLIDGRVTDPQYGSKDQPITLGLEEAPFDDLALFPPADAQISGRTWGSAKESLDLERYPWIFGFPGVGGTAATPGLWVDTDKLLIAGHPTTEGSTVTVHNLTDETSASIATTGEKDSLNRAVTTVDVSGFAGSDEADEYWIEWSSSGAGGVANHDGKAARGAGDVLRFMLEQSSVRWDRGRVAAILPALNLFKIDCAVVASPSQRLSPLDWVQQHLAPILPISARQGPEGLYYALFRYDSTAEQAVASINVDRSEASRDGAVSYSSTDQIANEIRLSYAFSGKENKPTQTYTLTGDEDTLSTDDKAVPNIACRISRDRFGLRQDDLSTSVVYDKTTAGMICGWLAACFALPSRTIAYTAEQRFAHVEPGDVVTLTDAEINASDLVCLVDSVTWSEQGSVGLVLRAIDNPARETF